MEIPECQEFPQRKKNKTPKDLAEEEYELPFSSIENQQQKRERSKSQKEREN